MPAVYIASDHAGFDRKEMLKVYLAGRGFEVKDFGPQALNPADDYPDFAHPLAQTTAKDGVPGIVLCGNGEGVCIVANKVKDVRAALGYSVNAATSSRNDDDSNVLCLPGRELTDDQAKAIVDAWLATPFSGEERHVRRIKKIAELEK
ncbi:MAG: RpiB/LacA/LacB family sugar-phosphate isomerase [Parcubacteria group bacterium]|nr:RpiB/LacA/LacB family sugar-phosphate isomerase [Parcubacteria group bacterium]